MYFTLIGTIFLASCAPQFRDSTGLGGVNINRIENSNLETTKSSKIQPEIPQMVDSVIVDFSKIDVTKLSGFADSQFVKVPSVRNSKIQVAVKVKEQSPQKKGVKKFLRKLGNEVAKISFYSSLIGLLSSKLLVFSVLAILLGVLATTIFKGVKVKFWAYLGIFLGVMGLISPALNTILAILILVALILILMKLMHWY